MNRIISALVLLSTILLAGCAGQGFYVAAQDTRNPQNFIQIAGRVPTQPALCVEENGDIYKVFCQSGQLNMRKVDGNRQYACVQQNGSVSAPIKPWVPHLTREACPMGVVDQKNQNQNYYNQSGGGISPQGLFPYGMKTDCPQIPVGNGLARCQ